MSHHPPSDLMLEEVAECRASGMTWDATAAKLQRSASTIKNWPRNYPDRWAAAFHKSELRIARDGCAHSIVVLRNLLASQDGKARHEAARIILQYRIALEKLDQQAGPPIIVISQIEADLQASRSLLRGLTDEQKEAYISAVRETRMLPGFQPGTGAGTVAD